MGVTEILSFCGFGVFFGGMCSFLLQRIIRKRDERVKTEQAATAARLELVEKQNKATQLGVQALLRDRLLQAFKFYLAQGHADYDDRQNVFNMYTQYESLGPNQVMEDLYHRFSELPLS